MYDQRADDATPRERSLPPVSSRIFADLILNIKDVDQMANSDFLIPNLIVRGHIAVFAAPPNGGKTTIFMYLCEKLAASGLDVLYINADSSPGDLKDHFHHSAKHNYQVISPDAKLGMGVQNVIEKLNRIASSAMNCDGLVLIFDTLKKFVDMLDKKQLKELLAMLRAITLKGATVCLLGHTNKYPGKDGNAIYEGMGDVRSDVDELIYLDGSRNPDTGDLEITTRPDKVRATIHPRSFIIELPSRTVTESATLISILSDEEINLLKLVIAAIKGGSATQADIVATVISRTTMGHNAIRDALKKFTNLSDAEIKVGPHPSGRGFMYSLV